jgi:glutathione S-transferase
MILYGTSTSRASRSLVALEELEIPYEHVPLFSRSRDRDADRALLNTINPNSHIPVLDDEGFVLWESMAINLYLAEKREGPLWPTNVKERAITIKWSFWAQTEIDRSDWNRARRSGDAAQKAADRQALIKALSILNHALLGRDYLLGDRFTIADVNVVTTLTEPHERGLIGWQKLDAQAEGLTSLSAWIARCSRRASYQKALSLP